MDTFAAKAYVIEFKDSLDGGSRWTLRRLIVGDGQVRSFSEPIDTARNHLYRVRRMP